MNKNNYALIMAGGVGSRFWPVSRTEFPKQFIDFFGVGKTLIQSTYDRFLQICPPENIFIVTNEIYIDIVKEQLPEIHQNQILAEPIMRNTAPCIAYGSKKIAEINPNAVIEVFVISFFISPFSTFLNLSRYYHAFKINAIAHFSIYCIIEKINKPKTAY